MKRSKEASMNEAVLVNFTKEQYDRAVARAKQHPDRSTDPSSITKGRGLITGCLGEIIVEDLLEHVQACDDDERQIKDKFNFDILMMDGTTLEVKSKGHSVSDCPSFYDCSVSAINPRQKADYYVFVRIHGKRLKGTYGFDHSNSSKAWICGYKSKEDMIQPQRLMKRGTVVQNSSSFHYVAKSSCYQIKICELQPLPKDFGKRTDLIKDGSLEFVSCDFKTFVKEQDETDYFYFSTGDLGGYFRGLAYLDTEQKKHFNANVDVYLYYNAMPSDRSILEEEKRKGEWFVQRFRRLKD